MNDISSSPVGLPWWRHGLVWMILAGPAVVVVAGIATFVIALRSPDPLVTDGTDGSRAADVRSSAPLEGRARAMLPAQQGRNHAALPVRPR